MVIKNLHALIKWGYGFPESINLLIDCKKRKKNGKIFKNGIPVAMYAIYR
jgi:hypothetical protein